MTPDGKGDDGRGWKEADIPPTSFWQAEGGRGNEDSRGGAAEALRCKLRREGVACLAAGHRSKALITGVGDVLTWGDGAHGQLGHASVGGGAAAQYSSGGGAVRRPTCRAD